MKETTRTELKVAVVDMQRVMSCLPNATILRRQGVNRAKSAKADISQIVYNVAEKEGYPCVFTKGPLLVGGVDITQKVLDTIQ